MKCINSNKRFGGKVIRFRPAAKDPPRYDDEGKYVNVDKRSYHENMPEQFRISSKFDESFAASGKFGSNMQIMSRCNGWMTVDTKTLSRKHAIGIELRAQVGK